MSAAEVWYVRTTFGALLGPMSDDTLKTMARVGDLISDDFVRHGEDGEWIEAAAVPKLFDAHRKSSTISVPLLAREKSATSPEPIAIAADPNPVIAEAHSNLGETLFANDDAPSCQRLSEEREGEAPAEPCVPTIQTSFTTPTMESEPLSKPRVPSTPGSAGASPSRIPVSRITSHVSDSIQDKLQDAKRRLSKRTSMLALCLLVVVWWCWPRMNRQICDQLFAMKTGLIEHRGDPDKKVNLDKYASQTLVELEAQIASLERKARWGNQEANFLLLASRDCLKPMLQSASQPQEELEAKLDYYLWALRGYYEGQPLGSPKPPNVASGIPKTN